jgi:hypothetical protein
VHAKPCEPFGDLRAYAGETLDGTVEQRWGGASDRGS